MFKSNSAKTAAKSVAGTALKITARHLIASKPEAGLILTTVCALAKAGAEAEDTQSLGGIATRIAEQYTDIFENDPTLRDDVADILDLMGLAADAVDLSAVTCLADTLCAVVS